MTAVMHNAAHSEDSSYLEPGAGALDLDVTPAGRVPATDGQVAGQVLVSNCFSIDSYHLGLRQTQTESCILSSRLFYRN